jgi:hypothetical protein
MVLDRQTTTARARAREESVEALASALDIRRCSGRRADQQRSRGGLRAAVIYRKLSLGSRSQGGERTIERLLSVDQTCPLQRRSLCGYLADVLAAKARGDPVPALA